MISSIIDMVLLAALAGTSAAVILMYRRLQRFDALQNEAAREFARTAAALDRAREAIAELSADGGEMAVALATRLNEARVVMNDIDEATLRTATAVAAAPEVPAAAAVAASLVPLHAAPAAAPVPLMASALAGPLSAQAEFGADETGPAASAGPVSAAIRIRNAARARIEAARAKAANKPAPAERDAPRPDQPDSVRLPERLAPTIHRASEESYASGPARRGNGPVMVLAKPRDDAASPAWTAPGLEALAPRLTWSDLARAARHAG